MEFVGLSVSVSLNTGESIKGVVQRVDGTTLELKSRGKLLRIDGTDISDLKIEAEKQVQFSDYKKSKGSSRKDKKKDTFAVAMDDMDKDFDFSASLQLFDKHAIFNEIRESDSTAPEARLVSHNKRDPQRKLKNTENVLDSKPLYECLSSSMATYTTIGGVQVPIVDLETKLAIESLALQTGLIEEIMIENGGRTIATLTLQALGGNRRIKAGPILDPPYVLILAGNSKTGAMALAGARHLINHGCKVDILADRNSNHLEYQLRLVLNCQGRLFHDASDLTRVSFEPIDFLIDSMTGSCIDKTIINWANSQRAPILSLNIPFGFIETQNSFIQPKYVLSFTLPLKSLQNLDGAEIFLGDCGIPWLVYKKVLNINLENVFGDKYIVGLIKD